jgi:hypothetical protein
LSALSDIGLHSSEYGLHSFRAGGATAAANSGVPDRLFKLQGRWKTDIENDGYVLDNVQYLTELTKQFLWFGYKTVLYSVSSIKKCLKF